MLTSKSDPFLNLGENSLFDSWLFTRSTARSHAFECGEEGAAQ